MVKQQCYVSDLPMISNLCHTPTSHKFDKVNFIKCFQKKPCQKYKFWCSKLLEQYYNEGKESVSKSNLLPKTYISYILINILYRMVRIPNEQDNTMFRLNIGPSRT